MDALNCLKKCSACRATKPVEEFSKTCLMRSGRNSQCKACAATAIRAWGILNRTKRTQQARIRLQDPLRRAKALAATRAWRETNKAHDAERQRRRRAYALKAVPKWAELDKIAVVYQKAREYGLTVDHIVPLKHSDVCGLHVWANLQLLDGSLNSAKRNLEFPRE